MTTADDHVLGTVVRLQVQRSRLKPGPRGARVYTTAPLLEVRALEVGPRGVVGQTDDGAVLDVHHADHPDTRNRGPNGLSLLPRAQYAWLRSRFGDHVADGTAGESLLLDTAAPWTLDDLAGPLVLETSDGDLLELIDPMVASPCVEFARFCLQQPPGRADAAIARTLAELDGGARGFYVTASGSAVVERGARLLRG